MSKKDSDKSRFLGCGCLAWTCVLILLVFLSGIALAPIGQQGHPPASASMQQARSLGMAFFAWAEDNNQTYPTGNSSTEVFQKLIDDGYVSDPTLFYLPMAGKVKPLPGQKLKPENVSFDFTDGLLPTSPGQLPLIFMTGYKVTYLPGGAAVPLVKPYPRFGMTNPNPTWIQWVLGGQVLYSGEGGLAVFYLNNSARFLKFDDAKGEVSNFISPDFKPDGKTYRQLTPDGVLP